MAWRLSNLRSALVGRIDDENRPGISPEPVSSLVASIREGEKENEDKDKVRLHRLRLRNVGWREVRVVRSPNGGRMLFFKDANRDIQAAITEQNADMAKLIMEACPLPIAMSRLADRKLLYESPANNALFAETEKQRQPTSAYTTSIRQNALNI